MSNPVTSTRTAKIGIWDDVSSFPFNGLIDEVRLSSTARSSDWILTSYNNQSSPSSFYNVGAEEIPEVEIISISLLTDGLVELGMAELEATADSSGDIQTVRVDTGPADLDIKSTVFSDGTGHTWALGTTNGDNQVIWEFSPDGSEWTIFEAADTPYLLASNVAQGATQDVYFRITMPTSSSSDEQFSATITILATAP